MKDFTLSPSQPDPAVPVILDGFGNQVHLASLNSFTRLDFVSGEPAKKPLWGEKWKSGVEVYSTLFPKNNAEQFAFVVKAFQGGARILRIHESGRAELFDQFYSEKIKLVKRTVLGTNGHLISPEKIVPKF